MSLFSTSATLRPSRCLLLRLASGPMLLTGILHLMSRPRSLSDAKVRNHEVRLTLNSGRREFDRLRPTRAMSRHFGRAAQRPLSPTADIKQTYPLPSPWPDASGSSPSPRASTVRPDRRARSRCFDTNLSRPKPACIARRCRENGGC